MNHQDLSILPFLKGALHRHMDDFPALLNGLSRSESQILTAILAGHSTSADIFVATQNMEERIFMGDWTFWSIVRRMAAAPSPLVTGWLRDVGVTAWLLVGMGLLVVGLVSLLALTNSIVVPLIAAGVIAAVAAPLVAWLQRHHVPRPLAAILLLVAFILLGALVVYVVVAGITSQTGDLKSHLGDAKNTIQGWLKDLGVDPSTANDAKQEASSAASDNRQRPAERARGGHRELSSLVFFLAMTTLSLLFLLADGPKIRAWGERHMGVPLPVAHTIGERVLQSLRGLLPRGHHRGGLQRPRGRRGRRWCSASRWRGRSRWSPSSPPTSPTSAPGPPAPSRS